MAAIRDHAVEFQFQLFHKTPAIEQSGQHVVVGEVQQSFVALTECAGRRLKCFDYFRNFTVLSCLEPDRQVSFGKFFERFVQVRNRCQGTA